MEAARRPRGRPPSRSWAFFTTVTEPQKQPSATCRHCQQLVHHHKKWGQARTHLMKCAQFLQFMESLPPMDVPEWYLAEVTRRQQHLVLNRGANIPIFQGPIPTQTPTQTFKSIQPAVMQMPMMPNTGNNGVKSMEKLNFKKIEEHVAMHLFTTMSPDNFVDEKLEFPFLAQAFQVCGGDFALPDKEKLMTEVLDRCYDSVRTRVDGFFKSGLVPASLSYEKAPANSEGGLVMNYMASLASSEKFPMYLESVEVPSDEVAHVDWAARDVARVVEKLSCPVAGCVMPCSSPESRQVRQLLETQFPAMYFHGCMRDALLTIVRQLFVQPEGGEATPFCRDLQQFALQCKDLVYFVPDSEPLTYFPETAANTENTAHVTVRRRLTVEDAFSAVLQAEAFLDVEGLENKFFSSGDSITILHKQLLEFVRSPKFSEKLRKYLDVVRPLHELLSAFQGSSNSSPLPLSEVYSSFSKLSTEFTSSALLLPEEKSVLRTLVGHQQEAVLGTAHELAYLLDPVLLGEDFSVDKKSQVEQLLLSSVGVNGAPLSETNKEVLYTQYKDYQKTALHQKTAKVDSVEFRKLKERKKSPLQFWFCDGAKWSALQAIACRVFVMPACAVSSTHATGVLPHQLRAQLGPSKSDKLAHVRVNTRQLQLAEVAVSSLVSVVPNPLNDSNSNDITASMVV
ncbi:hypothetical protein KRP22_008622 [Phytophthora ramorum]|uniref:uncharacterized protein n=1 Tax=Phytophthora ramorum TaxID=164328 RepID=UPI00309A4437|nr:hypothetical protein KRP23_2681 [Phytophthora ramorum]KAH7501980.1 hypothetical protein KRP22_7454 [Phytophthora ramorum]